MMNTIAIWFHDNWDMLVEIFMWTLTAMMAFIICAKIYKIVTFKFEAMDTVNLFFGGLWIFVLIIFGFDHIREYLQSFL